jgi:predicted nucleic acid-binding protein
MAIILNADVLIADERGRFDLKSWLVARPGEEVELAAITVTELFHGFERALGTQKQRRLAYIDGVLDAFRVHPYTARAAQVHAQIWAELESGGQMIRYHDLIVAATALEHGRDVATFNKRHFAVVKGLKVIEPI